MKSSSVRLEAVYEVPSAPVVFLSPTDVDPELRYTQGPTSYRVTATSLGAALVTQEPSGGCHARKSWSVGEWKAAELSMNPGGRASNEPRRQSFK